MINLNVNVLDQSGSNEIIQQDRMISVYSSAFGILREGLIKNIGINRMKGFLVRYGWDMGVSDAKKEMAKGSSLKELLMMGPVLHQQNGYIRKILYKADFEFESNIEEVKSVIGEGTWIGSYESEEHIKRLGVSETPVCYTNVGYLNGYLSTVCNHPVIAKEISCVGMGDSECKWVLKSQKEWKDDIQDELQYYYETPIVKELEYTYEQLLEQHNYITKVSNIHKRLTEEVINGNDLQSIADTVYEIVDIPVIIHDLNFRTSVYSGLKEEEFCNLEMDYNYYLDKNKNLNSLFKENSYKLVSMLKNNIISMDQHERLIAPIIVQKKIIGYCTFIYIQGRNQCTIDNFMILERVANAISLLLLNEMTHFEAFERMKGNFLEQLLNGQFLSSKEIFNRGKYVNLDLGKSFYIVVIGYNYKKIKMDNELSHHEQILSKAFLFFNDYKRNVLIGQREGNIVILITNDSDQKDISKLMVQFVSYLEKIFKTCQFKVGISTLGDQIEVASQYYDEAVLAQRMTLNQKIVMFESLGIFGVLINYKNVNGIKMVAKQILGPIYNHEGPKNLDLIKTLYVFLSNGGKLEKTMKELSLSMGGLTYRIQKIERTIGKDLRNPADAHQVYLILESMIAIGELKLN